MSLRLIIASERLPLFCAVAMSSNPFQYDLSQASNLLQIIPMSGMVCDFDKTPDLSASQENGTYASKVMTEHVFSITAIFY